MENTIEEIQNKLDVLTINNAQNLAHLKTLTIAFKELSYHVLEPDQAKNLFDGYYHTLYEKTHEILNQIGPELSQPAKIHFELLELKSFVDRQLKDL